MKINLPGKLLNSFKLEKPHASREAIGIMRILTYGWALFSTTRYLSFYPNYPYAEHCMEPMGLWLNLRPEPAVYISLLNLYRVAMVFSAVGFFTNAARWLSMTLLFVLQAAALNHCFYNHSILPVVLCLFFWALLDLDSGYRVDTVLSKKMRPPDRGSGPSLILYLRFFFALTFWATGFAKLRHSGFSWIFSDSMRNFLLMQNYFHKGIAAQLDFFLPINRFIANSEFLSRLVAFETVLIELSAPVALFVKRLQKVIVLQLLIMLGGIFLLMYIDFTAWFVLFIPWFSFEPAVRWINRIRWAPLARLRRDEH